MTSQSIKIHTRDQTKRFINEAYFHRMFPACFIYKRNEHVIFMHQTGDEKETRAGDVGQVRRLNMHTDDESIG
jgi:hypothetical protein